MSAQGALAELTFECVTCGRVFMLSPEDQAYFETQGQQVPKQCKECRQTQTTRQLSEAFKQAAEQDMGGLSKQLEARKRATEQASASNETATPKP